MVKEQCHFVRWDKVVWCLENTMLRLLEVCGRTFLASSMICLEMKSSWRLENSTFLRGIGRKKSERCSEQLEVSTWNLIYPGVPKAGDVLSPCTKYAILCVFNGPRLALHDVVWSVPKASGDHVHQCDAWVVLFHKRNRSSAVHILASIGKHRLFFRVNHEMQNVFGRVRRPQIAQLFLRGNAWID